MRDGDGPKLITNSDAICNDDTIGDDFVAPHAPVVTEVPDCDQPIIKKPPVISIHRKDNFVGQKMARQPTDVFANLQVERRATPAVTTDRDAAEQVFARCGDGFSTSSPPTGDKQSAETTDQLYSTRTRPQSCVGSAEQLCGRVRRTELSTQDRAAGSLSATSDASIDSSEEVVPLAAISVRNLDDHVKERLRIRAARHGRSMESEIRAILVDAVRELDDADGLFQEMLDRFGEIGGVELELLLRTTPVRAADFSS